MDIVKEAKRLALEEAGKHGKPIPLHFEISEQKALELAGRLNADKTIVRAGVYLMDLKLGEAAAQGRRREHVRMSADATREFLEKFGLDEETKRKIINCVEAHHGEVPFICREAEICANADCYRFIHPRGFFAYLAHKLMKSRSFDEALNSVESKLDEKYRILSLEVCKRELEKCYRQLKELIQISRQL